MNTIRWLVAVTLIAVLAGTAHGTVDEIASLDDAVKQGSVSVESVTGTGGSSGMVVDAVLVNATPTAQRILVHLAAPMFFRNRGTAQDMVATQVYGRDGSYWQQSDGTPYVEVGAASRLPVTFVAYCADFEKDNPSATDAFDVVPLPQRVETVMRQINAFEAENRGIDTTKSSQLALWVTQGHTLTAIGDRFSFDAKDEATMQAILATTFE